MRTIARFVSQVIVEEKEKTVEGKVYGCDRDTQHFTTWQTQSWFCLME